jgi:superfamily II DNA helicase RecQ
MFGYLSNASSNIGPDRYPLATALLTSIFSQIRYLQDQNFTVVQSTAGILYTQPSIQDQLWNGECSTAVASQEVLLRDTSYYWEVIVRVTKSTFSNHVHTIIINQCHLVRNWHDFRTDYFSLGAIRTHFQYHTMFALLTTKIPNESKLIINLLGRQPGLPQYNAAIDIQSSTLMVVLINLALC